MSPHGDSLEARVRRIEDRIQISECVIRYAMALDQADWDLFRETIADPIYIDFSDWSGMEPRSWARDEWAGFARDVLSGFDARQHISPNHVITFQSEDEATCWEATETVMADWDTRPISSPSSPRIAP